MSHILKFKVLGKVYEVDTRKYTKQEIDKMFPVDEKGLADLQSKNRDFSIEHNTICNLRSEARECEKILDYDKAISLYKQSVDFAESSEYMKLNMYSFDIERLIILYGKTKQVDTLKAFLNDTIKKYPRSKDSKKWRERLAKIKEKERNGRRKENNKKK